MGVGEGTAAGGALGMNQTKPTMARPRQVHRHGGLSSGVCPQCRNSRQGCVPPRVGSLGLEHRRSALPSSCGPCWPSVLARGAGPHRVSAAPHLPTQSWRRTPGPPGRRHTGTAGRSWAITKWSQRGVWGVLVPTLSSCGGAEAWLLNWSSPGEPRKSQCLDPNQTSPASTVVTMVTGNDSAEGQEGM